MRIVHLISILALGYCSALPVADIETDDSAVIPLDATEILIKKGFLMAPVPSGPAPTVAIEDDYGFGVEFPASDVISLNSSGQFWNSNHSIGAIIKLLMADENSPAPDNSSGVLFEAFSLPIHFVDSADADGADPINSTIPLRPTLATDSPAPDPTNNKSDISSAPVNSSGVLLDDFLLPIQLVNSTDDETTSERSRRQAGADPTNSSIPIQPTGESPSAPDPVNKTIISSVPSQTWSAAKIPHRNHRPKHNSTSTTIDNNRPATSSCADGTASSSNCSSPESATTSVERDNRIGQSELKVNESHVNGTLPDHAMKLHKTRHHTSSTIPPQTVSSCSDPWNCTAAATTTTTEAPSSEATWTTRRKRLRTKRPETSTERQPSGGAVQSQASTLPSTVWAVVSLQTKPTTSAPGTVPPGTSVLITIPDVTNGLNVSSEDLSSAISASLNGQRVTSIGSWSVNNANQSQDSRASPSMDPASTPVPSTPSLETIAPSTLTSVPETLSNVTSGFNVSSVDLSRAMSASLHGQPATFTEIGSIINANQWQSTALPSIDPVTTPVPTIPSPGTTSQLATSANVTSRLFSSALTRSSTSSANSFNDQPAISMENRSIIDANQSPDTTLPWAVAATTPLPTTMSPVTTSPPATTTRANSTNGTSNVTNSAGDPSATPFEGTSVTKITRTQNTTATAAIETTTSATSTTTAAPPVTTAAPTFGSRDNSTQHKSNHRRRPLTSAPAAPAMTTSVTTTATVDSAPNKDEQNLSSSSAMSSALNAIKNHVTIHRIRPSSTTTPTTAPITVAAEAAATTTSPESVDSPTTFGTKLKPVHHGLFNHRRPSTAPTTTVPKTTTSATVDNAAQLSARMNSTHRKPGQRHQTTTSAPPTTLPATTPTTLDSAADKQRQNTSISDSTSNGLVLTLSENRPIFNAAQSQDAASSTFTPVTTQQTPTTPDPSTTTAPATPAPNKVEQSRSALDSTSPGPVVTSSDNSPIFNVTQSQDAASSTITPVTTQPPTITAGPSTIAPIALTTVDNASQPGIRTNSTQRKPGQRRRTTTSAPPTTLPATTPTTLDSAANKQQQNSSTSDSTSNGLVATLSENRPIFNAAQSQDAASSTITPVTTQQTPTTPDPSTTTAPATPAPNKVEQSRSAANPTPPGPVVTSSDNHPIFNVTQSQDRVFSVIISKPIPDTTAAVADSATPFGTRLNPSHHDLFNHQRPTTWAPATRTAPVNNVALVSSRVNSTHRKPSHRHRTTTWAPATTLPATTVESVADRQQQNSSTSTWTGPTSSGNHPIFNKTRTQGASSFIISVTEKPIPMIYMPQKTVLAETFDPAVPAAAGGNSTHHRRRRPPAPPPPPPTQPGMLPTDAPANPTSHKRSQKHRPSSGHNATEPPQADNPSTANPPTTRPNSTPVPSAIPPNKVLPDIQVSKSFTVASTNAAASTGTAIAGTRVNGAPSIVAVTAAPTVATTAPTVVSVDPTTASIVQSPTAPLLSIVTGNTTLTVTSRQIIFPSPAASLTGPVSASQPSDPVTIAPAVVITSRTAPANAIPQLLSAPSTALPAAGAQSLAPALASTVTTSAVSSTATTSTFKQSAPVASPTRAVNAVSPPNNAATTIAPAVVITSQTAPASPPLPAPSSAPTSTLAAPAASPTRAASPPNNTPAAIAPAVVITSQTAPATATLPPLPGPSTALLAAGAQSPAPALPSTVTSTEAPSTAPTSTSAAPVASPTRAASPPNNTPAAITPVVLIKSQTSPTNATPPLLSATPTAPPAAQTSGPIVTSATAPTNTIKISQAAPPASVAAANPFPTLPTSTAPAGTPGSASPTITFIAPASLGQHASQEALLQTALFPLISANPSLLPFFPPFMTPAAPANSLAPPISAPSAPSFWPMPGSPLQ